MAEEELKTRKEFEAHFDQWRKDNPHGIYHSFQAWQHQQAKIDKLAKVLKRLRDNEEYLAPKAFNMVHDVIAKTVGGYDD